MIWARFRFLGNPMELELATASLRIWSTVSLFYQNFPIEFEIVQRRPCPGRYQSRLLITARRKIVWFNLMIRYQLSEPRLSTINQDMFFDRSSTESKFFRIFFLFPGKVKKIMFYSPNCRLYSAYRGLFRCCKKILTMVQQNSTEHGVVLQLL